MAHLDLKESDSAKVYEEIGKRIHELVQTWLDTTVDPALPVVLLAHCSVQGALLGNERTVMLGKDLVLPGSLVKDPRLDYVALGHIHKSQNLNENLHPPVIYPGSIERVDFGEAKDDKFFVIAHIERGSTQVEWRELTGIRPFIDRYVRLEDQEGINEKIHQALPSEEKMRDAILRLILEYPRDWEALIDEASLREITNDCFEFHLVKRPQMETRIRLPGDQTVGSLDALGLLDLYWKSNHTDPQEMEALNNLAADLIRDVNEN